MQDIGDARVQHGHTTFVQNSARSAEALGDPRHVLLENVTTSQVDSEATSSMGEHTRLVLLWIYCNSSDTMLFDGLAPDLAPDL